jgi:hypothetical protein
MKEWGQPVFLKGIYIYIYIYLYCMTSPRAEMRSDEPHVGRGQMRVEMQTPHNTELQVQLAYPHHRRADT